ncbi:MAG: transcriptional repressor [Acidaminococcus sp.]|uniref:Fur family transcriptional regulator n=1 Tax=Acidaminococcus TaxID=904 RepID=UPI0026DFE16A|nr:transcriptional repressor [Acidaminococcus sp.]MDO5596783.1 transcriptional repressor [Acidaminococcus sp.]
MHKTELPLDAQGLIRQTGLKCTSARLQVLQLLLAQQEVLSADEVFEKLHQAGAKLNFSTVYRILESFTEKKLTEKVLLPQSRKYGFLVYTLSHTHHLICLGCHKVVNLEGCPLHGFEEELARKTHFQIVGHALELYGYCEECQKKGLPR